MNKKLLAAAVAGALVVPSAAMAVEVFGTVDTGLRSQSKACVDAACTQTGSVVSVTDGERTTNRWGFRGSEDLGGGLMTNYWFEGQFGSDTGALGSSPALGNGPTAATANLNQGLFQRKMVVGLSKGGMSVDLGRDYTVNFKTQGIYDPMSYTYTGITPTAGTNTAGVRSSNMVTAGFRFGTGGIRLDYALGEAVDSTSNGTRYGGNADFAIGPVTIAGAYSTQKNDITTTNTLTTDTWNLGGAWVLGGFTFRLGASETDYKTDAVSDVLKTPMLTAGVQYAFSPTLNGRVGYYDTKFKVAGTEVGSRKVAIVALDYYLSKRTTLYVAFDRTNIKDLTASISNTGVATISTTPDVGAVLGVNSADGSTGISAGIAHAF